MLLPKRLPKVEMHSAQLEITHAIPLATILPIHAIVDKTTGEKNNVEDNGL